MEVDSTSEASVSPLSDEGNTTLVDSGYQCRESQLFREFRVIGLVCNNIPFAYQRLGDTFFITTSIGNAFQVYEGKQLRLRLASRSTTGPITCILTNKELTITSVGNEVHLWYRTYTVRFFFSFFIFNFRFVCKKKVEKKTKKV